MGAEELAGQVLGLTGLKAGKDAGVVAEAVLKPLRLLVWKVIVDCLDMVSGRG